MKKTFIILSLLVATALAIPSLNETINNWKNQYNQNTGGEPPRAVVARILQESPATGGVIQVLDKDTGLVRNLAADDLPVYSNVATATITSAAAVTAVNLVPASAVPNGKKIYVTNFVAKVNGATNWATTATVKIQDTNGTPVDFFTMAVAALTGNAEVRPGTSNITSAAAYNLGTGGTAAKGLQLKGDANGTGSDLVVTVTYFIK